MMNCKLKTSAWLGLALAVLAPSGVATAAGEPVDVPYTNTFEDYPVGFMISNTNGWVPAYTNPAAAIVTNWIGWNSNYPNPYLTNVVPTHSNVLNLAGEVTNLFTANNGSPYAYITLSVLPQFRESPPDNAVVNDPPFVAFYINSQSNVVFYHTHWDGSYQAPRWSTNTWDTITSNEWVRFNITIAYSWLTDPENPAPDWPTSQGDEFFRIQIGTNAYFTNEYSYNQASVNGTPADSQAFGPATWFMCEKGNGGGPLAYLQFQGGPALSSITLSGYAQVDDLVVTFALPGDTNAPVVEEYTTRGIPTKLNPWYDLYPACTNRDGGLTPEQADVLDEDSDGLLNWQEFWAGTVPTDPDSVLKFITVGTNYNISWFGGTNSRLDPNYWTIHRSTNLIGTGGDTWTNLPSTNYFGRVVGTNIWLDPDGPSFGNVLFYRITAATNN